MSREYFTAYHSYLEAIEALDDAERGRLFTACLAYSSTGEVPPMTGNERFVFPSMRSQIDRDIHRYDEKSASQRAKVRKRWDVREQAQDDTSAEDTAVCVGIPGDTGDTAVCVGIPGDTIEKEKEKSKAMKMDMEKATTSLHPPVSPFPPDDDDDDHDEDEDAGEASPAHVGETGETGRAGTGMRALKARWRATGGKVNAENAAALRALLSAYPQADVLDAMTAANDYGAGGRMAYVRAVLADWKQNGRAKKAAGPSPGAGSASAAGPSPGVRSAQQGTGDVMLRYTPQERRATYSAAVLTFDD